MTSKPRLSLKLSAKPPDTNLQPGKSETSNRRRAKRLVLPDDEDSDQDRDQDQDQDPYSATRSSPSESSARRSRTLAEYSGSDLTEPESEPEPEPEPDSYPLSQPSSSSHLKRTKGRKPTDGPSAKKKRIQQDESSDEEYHAGAPSGDDDDLVIHTKRQSKLTAKAKANTGKSKSFTVGARDERKAGRPQQSNSMEASRKIRTKRAREVSTEDDPVNVVDDTETRPDTRSPSPPKEPAAPPAKRRKYPTIKKNKVPGAATDPVPPAKTGSNNAATKSTSTVAKVPDLPKPPSASSRVPPMMVGHAEYDLRDQNVWGSLFKSNNNTLGSGSVKQKKDEEKQKELNKMRDEARAKRLSEMASRRHLTPPFDLQTQYEKIKRFEDTMRHRLFPNVLAAKWRDIYDDERKKAYKAQSWSTSGNGQDGQTRAHLDR